MDIISVIGVDWLKALTWILALSVLIGGFFAHKRQFLWPLIEALGSFVALNLAAGVYILFNLTDSRWTTTVSEQVSTPQLPSSPLFAQITDPLNSFLSSTTGTINDLLVYQNAVEHVIPVAVSFFVVAAVAGVLFVIMLSIAIGRMVKRMASLHGRLEVVERYVAEQKSAT